MKSQVLGSINRRREYILQNIHLSSIKKQSSIAQLARASYAILWTFQSASFIRSSLWHVAVAYPICHSASCKIPYLALRKRRLRISKKEAFRSHGSLISRRWAYLEATSISMETFIDRHLASHVLLIKP